MIASRAFNHVEQVHKISLTAPCHMELLGVSNVVDHMTIRSDGRYTQFSLSSRDESQGNMWRNHVLSTLMKINLMAQISPTLSLSSQQTTI